MKAGNFLSLLEKYVFWHLTNYFLREENYRLIHLHEEKFELWLDNPGKKDRPVIRIQMREVGWSSVIERDISNTLQVAENLRKQMGRMKLPLINLYISPFAPVGNESASFHDPVTSQNKKITLYNFLLAEDQMGAALSKLASHLQISEEKLGLTGPVTEEMVTAERDAVIGYITKKVSREQQQARKEKPLVTYTFIAVAVIAFLLTWLSDHQLTTYTFLKWGAFFNPLVYEGEWWRFITPIFLHGDFMHIASNCVMLYVVGPWAEKVYGKWRYAVILLLGGVAGNIATFALNSEAVSLGASTSLFAVFGALLYLVVIKPHVYAKSIGTSIAALVAINLVIDIFMPGISLSGHVGGLVGGFFLAGALSIKKQYFHWKQFFYGGAVCVLSCLFLYLGFSKQYDPIDARASNSFAQSYLNDHKPTEANKLFSYLIQANSADEYTYTLMASEALDKQNYEEAKKLADKAISMNPTLPDPHYILSVCYLHEGNERQAEEQAKKAADLSDNEFYKEYYHQFEQNKVE
ncbi:rhomboid family protein [Listeria ilorinensis]|uniref:rhomboid family protein n=1 Tax=Listeria ilorinensis TaxID=2867439 RepID=UPI001EF5E70C|nr:rhomboid family intramembrane serine protease [Listeria ilorinensis]